MIRQSPTSRAMLTALLFPLILVVSCTDVPPVDYESTSDVGALDVDVSYDVGSRDSGCVSGVQSSGAFFEVCKPEGYDGTLVLWAHGFVMPQLPLTIPEQEGGWNVKDFILDGNHGYAATSYYTNGLVEPLKGVKDIRELISIFTREFERPRRTYIIGVSNGAYLSTLLMEKNSGLIDGAVTGCGPVGSYLAQIEYLGDIASLFDLFFGDVQILPEALGFGTGLPGDQTGYDETLIPALEMIGAGLGVSGRDALGFLIGQAMQAHPEKTGMLLHAVQMTSSISRGRPLYASATEGVTLIVYAMVYNAFNADDVLGKLGGAFFDNRDRIYADLADEGFRTFVNAMVERYEARTSVLARLNSQYETSGHLRVPTVALHTTRDPLVPAWHQALYLDKLGSRSWIYDASEVEAFGHCAFQPEDLSDAWSTLVSALAAG